MYMALGLEESGGLTRTYFWNIRELARDKDFAEFKKIFQEIFKNLLTNKIVGCIINSTITKERGIHNEEERKNIFRP